ncbi:hypothetical protein QQ054_12295 [Oscillatoria amoena NRMC-F 0135]|nr:hypothetical protein [Oscillatoria amoena NRMC-F 0135]
MPQIPQDIPHQTEPVDFTYLPNIILYIALPLLLVIFYFYWKRRYKK